MVMMSLIAIPMMTIFASAQSFKGFSSSIPINHYLNGVFRPVDTEVNLEMSHNNTLFNEIQGTFAQIGSNPKHIGTRDAGYHWFDGDGMVHAAHFHKNKILYRNHWVKTKRLRAEERWGHKMYLYFGELRGFHGMMEILKWTICQYFALVPGAKGTANTAFVTWKNRTFALHEGDMPYELDIDYESGEITTKGQWTWPQMKSVTAHPKIDEMRDEMYMYGYNNYDFSEGRFFHNVLDEKMVVTTRSNFSLLNNGMVHDIAQTKNHIIIPDLPLKYDFNQIMKNKLPMVFDKNGTTRFGVYHKDDPNTIEWYTSSENIFLFHFCKAYETETDFIVHACNMDYLDMMDFVHLENNELKIRGNLRLQKITLDKRTKKATIIKNRFIENLKEVNIPYNLDFPIESNNKNDIYCSIFDATSGKIIGIVKMSTINFTRRKPKVYLLPYGRFMNSEPQLVTIKKKEYIMSFTYDLNDQAFISIIDIEKNDIEDVAIPTRIPPGFHSLWKSHNK